ncbi:MAG TPA: winged helix-turn-helix domain-containing protein [Terriglobales bacterium]|nr:winged helix-turn-helix domain-containing protein [Terriglobales bacterium]
MDSETSHSYRFGEFQIEETKRQLLRNGQAVPLTPKVFDTLLYLVERRGSLVDKDELMRAIWPDTIVEENNLNQNISVLRRILGESRGENRYIATVPGKGYRFLANVEVLETASSGAPEISSRTTLAVLPFENLSADPGREYLADGLTEETIAALGQIDPEHLGVIGRTSVLAYKRTTKTAAEIGRELKAAYLVESSLRAEGERLRITAKLIRVQDQIQIWSASFDSEPGSMLAFQRELSAAIAEQIRLRLSPERLSALARRQTRNAEAYDLYLRGRHFWNQLTPATTRRAVEYFSRATERDPEYALAWSGIADSYAASPINGDVSPAAVAQRGREAAAHAIAAEPELAESQTSLGFVKFWLDWDWPSAEAAFRKAIVCDPNYPMAHRILGIALSHMGQHEEALQTIQRARELDPLLAVNQALSSQVAFAARDCEAAMKFARQAIVTDPEFWIGHLQLGQAAAQMGRTELALEALNNAGRFSGGNSKVISLRGYLFGKVRQRDKAEETLGMLESVSRDRYVPPYAMALVHAGLGQNDEAFAWLGRALDARDVHLIFLTVDPKWDAFRSDPRFVDLLARCAFTPAA